MLTAAQPLAYCRFVTGWGPTSVPIRFYIALGRKRRQARGGGRESA